MEDISLASDLVIYLTTVGILGIFTWVLFVIYFSAGKYLEKGAFEIAFALRKSSYEDFAKTVLAQTDRSFKLLKQ